MVVRPRTDRVHSLRTDDRCKCWFNWQYAANLPYCPRADGTIDIATVVHS